MPAPKQEQKPDTSASKDPQFNTVDASGQNIQQATRAGINQEAQTSTVPLNKTGIGDDSISIHGKYGTGKRGVAKNQGEKS